MHDHSHPLQEGSEARFERLDNDNIQKWGNRWFFKKIVRESSCAHANISPLLLAWQRRSCCLQFQNQSLKRQASLEWSGLSLRSFPPKHANEAGARIQTAGQNPWNTGQISFLRKSVKAAAWPDLEWRLWPRDKNGFFGESRNVENCRIGSQKWRQNSTMGYHGSESGGDALKCDIFFNRKISPSHLAQGFRHVGFFSEKTKRFGTCVFFVANSMHTLWNGHTPQLVVCMCPLIPWHVVDHSYCLSLDCKCTHIYIYAHTCIQKQNMRMNVCVVCTRTRMCLCTCTRA